jgi:cytochrome c oxidase assembly protein subunit 11
MKTAYYFATVAVFVFGVSYASVPLYKVFCQMTGFGGTTQVATEEKARKIVPVEGGKIIKIYFAGNVVSTMPWKFYPTQQTVKVIPGETALAFYTVENTSDKAITGIATYNVHPPKAGLYFNKIQCFCFEEQRLQPKEEIDMPVFFFIDPEIVNDPAMENITNITLSYTFFKTGEEQIITEDKSNKNKEEKKEITATGELKDVKQ